MLETFIVNTLMGSVVLKMFGDLYNCTATYLPFQKASKLDEKDKRYTAGEPRTNSYMTFFYGPLHIDVPVLSNQQEVTHNSCVRAQGVVWKTCRERWRIRMGGETERDG